MESKMERGVRARLEARNRRVHLEGGRERRGNGRRLLVF